MKNSNQIVNNQSSIINRRLRVVFFGAGKYVVPIIKILKENFDLVLVVTTEGGANETVPAFCKVDNIPLISVKDFSKGDIEKIKETGAEVAVLGYFGLLLPHDVLAVFPHGIINTHPSLLPLYRGPTPVQNAILNGDAKTGMTIIKLDEELDHGPILIQREEWIKETDTTDSLHDRLFKMGAELVLQILKDVEQGKNVEERQQDHSKATFTDHLSRESGLIDADSPPDEEKLGRMVRSYFPWPSVWTNYKLNDKEVLIKLLPNQMIQVEGKKVMSYKDFINGYPGGKVFLQKFSLI